MHDRDFRRVLLVKVREIVARLLRDDAREQQDDHGQSSQPAVQCVDEFGEFLHFRTVLSSASPLCAGKQKRHRTGSGSASLRNNISIIPDSEPKIKSRPPIW